MRFFEVSRSGERRVRAAGAASGVGAAGGSPAWGGAGGNFGREIPRVCECFGEFARVLEKRPGLDEKKRAWF